MCNTASEASAEKKIGLPSKLTPTTGLPKKICDPHDGENAVRINKHSQIVDSVSACNRGFTQFVTGISKLVSLEKKIALVLRTLRFTKSETYHPLTQFTPN